MKKRIVSMLLCAAMCMTAVPSAYAMEVDSFTETAAEGSDEGFEDLTAVPSKEAGETGTESETVTGTETETETETTTEITDIGQDELTGADVQESTVQEEPSADASGLDADSQESLFNDGNVFAGEDLSAQEAGNTAGSWRWDQASGAFSYYDPSGNQVALPQLDQEYQAQGKYTGYYLIDGSLLENPVYMYAETEFTLDDAMKYDDTGDDDEIPDDSGDGDDSTDSTTMTREDAIKIQKNKVSSLKLDIEESNLNITKLENKVKNKLVTSKLDGTVAYIGDEATGSYNGDAFLKVKSKDGFYVTGTVSELMRDQMKEGTLLQCTSYDSGSFEAKVLNVSDYPVDSSNNFYYGGDSNPNVSYYTFNAEITDQSLQFTDQDYVTISLKSNKLSKGSLVVMKAFIRTENGTSYVYKDVKGTLKKQQVTVGSIVNSGYYAIVTSGLKSDDLLAFPYGNTVQEGAKTKEVTLDDMYNE